jgi:multiple sugar transport system permease protein/putative aldouronate transport system permease protein
MQKGGIRDSVGDRLLVISFYSFLSVFALFCLVPFWMMITTAFTDEISFLINGFRLWPSEFSLDAMRFVFRTPTVPMGYRVTLIVTFAGTALSMLATVMLAYPLSNKKVKYRNHIAFFIYFTMLFSGGLIPTYILISRYLGMRNSLWVFLIPSLINAWNMFLMRNFFAAIPDSFAESARMDGASEYRILARIVLPLALPSIATISLFYALENWNAWMPALLYIDREELYPLQYIIVRMIRNINFVRNAMNDQTLSSIGIELPMIPANSVRMATAMVTIGPIIFLYPFVQRFFIKGLTIGGIKG